MAVNEKEKEQHVHTALTKGEVVEKSNFQKAIGLFFADDAEMVSESIVDDFIKPRMKSFAKESVMQFKRFLVDSLTGCIQMLVYGKAAQKNTTTTTFRTGGTNYTAFFEGTPVSTSTVTLTTPTTQLTSEYGVVAVRIDTYGNAQSVLGEMIGLLKRYSHVTVADYYQLVGVTPKKTDWNYGWFDLDDVNIVAYAGGWLLQFPKPVPM